MSGTRIPLDPNHHPVLGLLANDGSGDILPGLIDTATEGLIVDAPTGPLGFTGDYDSMEYTNTSALVDTYQFFVGGLAGTVAFTLTVTYTDDTKSQVSTVVRT